MAFEGADEVGGEGVAAGERGGRGGGGRRRGLGLCEFFGEDAEGAFFVDVGVTEGEGDGQGAQIHHVDVETEQGGPELRDVDDVEASASHGEGLEETV